MRNVSATVIWKLNVNENGPSMTNENETVKNDQIAHRLFTKFALVVDDARNVRTEAPRDDKWDK